MSKKLLLIGGGGHCRSVLDSVLKLNRYDEIGIIDKNPNAAALGIKVLGNDDDVSRLYADGWTDAIITVGSVGDTSIRSRLFRMVSEIGMCVPTIIDPSAIVSVSVLIGDGTFIGKGAIVNTGSVIGNCVIVNTGAVIEHDCEIGDFVHISTGSSLCGEVHIGANTHIGAGSVIRQQIRIGQDTLIGAGSVVVTDIPDHRKAFGNPCRIVES